MDFLRKKMKGTPTGEALPTSTPDVKSTETTPYQSGVPSEFEKNTTEPSVHSARSKSDSQHPDGADPATQPTVGANAIESAEKKLEAIEKGDEKNGEEDAEEEDDTEYPKAMKLYLITIALCLSVFCLALDNTVSTPKDNGVLHLCGEYVVSRTSRPSPNNIEDTC